MSLTCIVCNTDVNDTFQIIRPQAIICKGNNQDNRCYSAICIKCIPRKLEYEEKGISFLKNSYLFVNCPICNEHIYKIEFSSTAKKYIKKQGNHISKNLKKHLIQKLLSYILRKPFSKKK